MTDGWAAVEGPITGGRRGRPFAASMLDVGSYGYAEDEYLLSGTAVRYRDVDGSTARRDGRWQAEPADPADYRTRLLVYRPTEPERFCGTVILTWNNVTAGHDLFGTDSLEVLEGGFALACLTTQKVGIDGLPPLHQGLANWDPERYGDLTIPSDDWSYDIFTQAARAVGPKRSTEIDPMGGLAVERVVAFGASQSAGRLATYLNAVQPRSGALDGCILAIYFGSGTALEVGEAVVDLAAMGDIPPEERLRGENLIRDDLDIPVFVVNSELEATSCHAVRQPDTDTFRYWEVAGSCHVSQQATAARAAMHERDGIVSMPRGPGGNAIPMPLVYDAVFAHVHRWLRDGVAPPVQPKIDFEGDPPVISRDATGLATGGVRLPQVEVPLAVNSAIPRSEGILAYLDGTCEPFTRAEAEARYGDRATYLARFEEAANASVDAGVLRPRDVPKLVAEADHRWSALT